MLFRSTTTVTAVNRNVVTVSGTPYWQFTVANASGISTSTSLAFTTTLTNLDGSIQSNVPSVSGMEYFTTSGWLTEGQLQNNDSLRGTLVESLPVTFLAGGGWGVHAYRRSLDGGLGAVSLWYEGYLGGNAMSTMQSSTKQMPGSWGPMVDFWQDQYYGCYGWTNMKNGVISST